jgi:hypothetical protein
MKYIISENQIYIIRRLQQFIDIVEDQIDGYEKNQNNSWWCKNSSPDYFYDNVRDRSIDEFITRNWDFFHNTSNEEKSNLNINILYDIVKDNYGNYIKNLFVRKCGKSRF